MRTINYILFFVLMIGWNTTYCQGSILQKGFLVACGNDRVLIIDPDRSTDLQNKIIWQWSVKEATNLPSDYPKLLRSLDECKPVMENTKLLITSSSGATILLDIATKNVDFYAKTPMAHSADLLPGNKIAVSNSIHKYGNSLELYDLKYPEKVLYKDSIYSGHGVVWNATKKLMYVLGFDQLRAYRLEKWNTDHPNLKLYKSWRLPDKNGHDLSRVNANKLLITTHHNVFEFNTNTQKFTVFKPLENKVSIKSVNVNPFDKQIVYTIAEESWWTSHVYLLNPAKTLYIPDIRLYKVRVAP